MSGPDGATPDRIGDWQFTYAFLAALANCSILMKGSASCGCPALMALLLITSGGSDFRKAQRHNRHPQQQNDHARLKVRGGEMEAA